MEAKLLVLAPVEIAGTEFQLQLPVTFGRSRDAKIKLVHGQISRLHCEVFEANGQLRVRDLGSLNGTFINGERVDDAVLLPGALLNVGAVTFKAVYGQMPNEADDSTVEFGHRKPTDTVTTTATVMADQFPQFHAVPAQAIDEIPDFSALPVAAKPAVPVKIAAPVVPAAPVMNPPPANAVPPPFVQPVQTAQPVTPPVAPPTVPAAASPVIGPPPTADDVDSWLGTEAADLPAEDDDLQSFFKNMK